MTPISFLLYLLPLTTLTIFSSKYCLLTASTSFCCCQSSTLMPTALTAMNLDLNTAAMMRQQRCACCLPLAAQCRIPIRWFGLGHGNPFMIGVQWKVGLHFRCPLYRADCGQPNSMMSPVGASVLADVSVMGEIALMSLLQREYLWEGRYLSPIRQRYSHPLEMMIRAYNQGTMCASSMHTRVNYLFLSNQEVTQEGQMQYAWILVLLLLLPLLIILYPIPDNYSLSLVAWSDTITAGCFNALHSAMSQAIISVTGYVMGCIIRVVRPLNTCRQSLLTANIAAVIFLNIVLLYSFFIVNGYLSVSCMKGTYVLNSLSMSRPMYDLEVIFDVKRIQSLGEKYYLD